MIKFTSTGTLPNIIYMYFKITIFSACKCFFGEETLPYVKRACKHVQDVCGGVGVFVGVCVYKTTKVAEICPNFVSHLSVISNFVRDVCANL